MVGPGLTRNFVVVGKSSQNSPKPVLIFWSSIPFYVYTLLKAVGYYDLSVLSMSVMGFQKKKLDGQTSNLTAAPRQFADSPTGRALFHLQITSDRHPAFFRR